MFVKIGKRIIPTLNMVDVEIFEPGDTIEGSWTDTTAEKLTVRIWTNAPYGGSDGHSGSIAPYKIHLYGEDAEKFLTALSVYEPVLEGEER